MGLFSNEETLTTWISEDKKNITEKDNIEKSFKKDDTIMFNIGSIVKHKIQNLGIGIIFKIVNNELYWIAWKDKKDRLTSLPCKINIHSYKEIEEYKDFLTN